MKLVLLGVGNAALAVAEAAANAGSYEKIFGTTRSVEKMPVLEELQISPLLAAELFDKEHREEFRALLTGAHVVVSFPPDGESDSKLAALAENAAKIVYISSTSVFGKASGVVDENTAVDRDDDKSKRRLDAEDDWYNAGGIIIRAPGLYGPATGLHIRLTDKNYRVAGDGSNHISRIHLDDLAAIILAALDRGKRSFIYVCGDLSPVPQIEVIEYVCQRMGLPLPESMPVENAHITLRGDRQVNGGKILADLGVMLKYPTYKEGYEQCMNASRVLSI